MIKIFLLLAFLHVCTGNFRSRGKDEPGLDAKRFIFDANHQLTGWASWEQYAACATLCVSGYEQQTKECCDTGNNRLCYMIPWDKLRSHIGTCPVDGHFGAWGVWTDCSTTCGGGKRLRNRSCIFDSAAPRGNNCTGDFEENQSCNQELCPVDGVFGSWSQWTTCSVTCGSGNQERNRSCTYGDAIAPRGNNCTGSTNQKQSCNTNLCPVDGVLEQWSQWTTCSVSCEVGNQDRTRSCIFDPIAPRGRDCTGSLNQTRSCNYGKCPVDGHFGAWGVWTDCSTTCGGGKRLRNRSCIFYSAAPRGKNCTGDFEENQSCNQELCPVDGVFGSWSQWTTCSVTCGGGNQERNRSCTYGDAIAPRGNDCFGSANQIQSCNTNLCPVDGVFEQWSQWTTCSASCGGGNQDRTRSCIFDPIAPRGRDCTGSLNQTRSCNTYLCPVDGVWTAWSNWSTCSATCGGGHMGRHRECNFFAGAPHGAACTGSAKQTQTCNENACAVDGVFEQWSQWTLCSASCGGGNQDRTRSCIFDPMAPRGRDCTGNSNQTRSCNYDLCPVDGVWTAWSNWSTCSATCGIGSADRHRECHFSSVAPHGANCAGSAKKTQTCNENACAVDGVWTTWSSWSTCSATCGGGQKHRRRYCSFPPHVRQGDYCAGSARQAKSCSNITCTVPMTPRTCYQCLGPPVICERLNTPQSCPLDKQYCINTLENFSDATRTLDMRCGTREECQKGWYEKYSHNDACTKFTSQYIYTSTFSCEFCCDTDSCNEKVNPDSKWHP